ncbi:hypothetical protein BofuT4_uP012010.1 [Botrytis cinerea T4]|uniref:Uncharacterized protein n=1 Tax=Botryotinia fuckeliana (strain T4) TaxID=999810 RepID=G2XS88_BOTF4|nr:hypothetical protein BofuT4_uP012010.1 [Botrytis cinerea T4]
MPYEYRFRRDPTECSREVSDTGGSLGLDRAQHKRKKSLDGEKVDWQAGRLVGR